MEEFVMGQRLREMFANNQFRSGDLYIKKETETENTYLEVLVFLGKNFGSENAYAIRASISYLQGGKDFFSVKTESELERMIQQENYQKQS